MVARVGTKVRTAEDPKICITDLAGEVIVAPVSDDEATTRLEKAMELTQRDLRLAEVVEDAGRHYPFEAGVEKWQLLGPGRPEVFWNFGKISKNSKNFEICENARK